MGIFDRLFRRRRVSRENLASLGNEDIRNIVAESLEATEATHDLVEQARQALERARDLMRQGLYEESLERFRESLTAWEKQSALCREQGLRDLWLEMPEKVAREFEAVRIAYLDILEPESFRFLARRAGLIRRLLDELLALGRQPEGAPEKTIYESFPAHQREEIRNLIFQAQRRGWLKREKVGGRYALRTAPDAPGAIPAADSQDDT